MNEQPHQASPIPKLAVELLAEHLSDAGSTSDLASLSLLARRHVPDIQRVLFRHIIIRTFRRCRGLTRTLRSEGTAERRIELASMIRKISAVLNAQPNPGDQLFVSRDLIDLYVLCPELKHIVLEGPEELFPDIMALPYLGELTSIQTLTLTGPPGHLGLFLLCLLPSLEALHLFGDMPTSQFTGTFPVSGNGLRCITWGLTSPPTVEAIRWLFANSDGVTGGDLTLVTSPPSALELEHIREYASLRGMLFHSAAVTEVLNPGQP